MIAHASDRSGFVVWAQITVRETELERFIVAIRQLAQRSVSDEPGCTQYDLIELDRATRQFGVYEVYRDAAAYEKHKLSPHFGAWSAVVDEFVENGGVEVRSGLRIPT